MNPHRRERDHEGLFIAPCLVTPELDQASLA
jgi:hypothetical protein